MKFRDSLYIYTWISSQHSFISRSLLVRKDKINSDSALMHLSLCRRSDWAWVLSLKCHWTEFKPLKFRIHLLLVLMALVIYKVMAVIFSKRNLFFSCYMHICFYFIICVWGGFLGEEWNPGRRVESTNA